MISETLRRWNQPASDPARDLGWAVRIGFLTVTVVLAILTFLMAMSVPFYVQIYADMLGGKPLPALTAFVLARPTFWAVRTFMLPTVAFGFAILVRRHSVAVTGISLATLGLLMESLCIGFGVWLPLLSLDRMQQFQ